MGKNEFLTPKAIGNRIKAKGLQKLRWYCQMCQKQCRDENGFKCHQNSESHKRQMEVFGQNPGRVIYGYTEEFEKGFMELLKRAHPNTRVAAKVVYNEYIADRHHVHMNSTKWLTLSEFVQHLGETGQCRIENTPKGWFISLIKEEDKIERERRLKRERAEKGEEERNRAMIESQVKRARTDGAEDVSGAIAGSELQRDKDGEAVRIALAGPSRLKPALLEAKPDPLATKAFAESDRGNRVEGSANGHSQPAAQKRKTAVQAVMEQEEQMKQMKAQRAAAAAPAALLPTAETLKKAGDKPWLHKRIIVKVISKSLRDTAYYKKKALVRKIVDGFIGEVEMLDSGDVLRVDQRELETVLPDIGKPVLVVSGADKGEEAMMKAIHTADFVAEIKLKTGRHAGQSVKLPYESICKLQKS